MWECVCDGDCRAATCQLPPPPGSPVLSSQGELTAPAEQDWVPAVVTPSHPPPSHLPAPVCLSPELELPTAWVGVCGRGEWGPRQASGWTQEACSEG